MDTRKRSPFLEVGCLSDRQEQEQNAQGVENHRHKRQRIEAKHDETVLHSRYANLSDEET